MADEFECVAFGVFEEEGFGAEIGERCGDRFESEIGQALVLGIVLVFVDFKREVVEGEWAEGFAWGELAFGGDVAGGVDEDQHLWVCLTEGGVEWGDREEDDRWVCLRELGVVFEAEDGGVELGHRG